jgi:hypothetical protein
MKKMLGVALLCSTCLFGCNQAIELNTGEKIPYGVEEETDHHGQTNLVLAVKNYEDISKQFINKFGEEYVKNYLKENNDIVVEVNIRVYEKSGNEYHIGTLVFCYFEETDEVVWGEMYGNVF